MKRIILNVDEMIEPPPHKIVWYYAEYQPQLEKELGHMVHFREGVPDLDEFDGVVPTLIILDDLMAQTGSETAKLFTQVSHHRNLSVWLLMQNFFHRGKNTRNTSLNAQYTIFFKNPRDKLQIKNLARQAMDTDSPAMVEAFKAATQNPHGYLLVDMKQETPEHYRMRTNIFPGEDFRIFASKKEFKDNVIEITRNYNTT